MTDTSLRDRLIVALDLDVDGSLSLARQLSGRVGWLKVGMTLFYEAGPDIVIRLRDLGFNVFLDLKLHDIPHQVRGAARSVAHLGAGMLTVHASGGQAMVRAAVDGAREGAADSDVAPPTVLAVTVLTSMDDATLSAIGVGRGASEQVPLLASLALDAGAGGVVCSPQEATRLRGVLGPEPFIVTPGVRPAGTAIGDQSRVATPAEAIRDGASHLVVGRPITGAPDPVEAAEQIIAQMKESVQ